MTGPRLVAGWTCGRCGQHVRPAPGQIVPTLAQHAASCPARKVLDLPPLTVRETAAALNVDIKTVEKWIAQRRLSSIKMGRLRRVPVAMVERAQRDGIPLRAPPRSTSPRLPRASAPEPPETMPGPAPLAQIEQLPARPRRLTPQPMHQEESA